MKKWVPFPGCNTTQIIGNIYLLEYNNKINFVYKYGKKPTQINISDLTIKELNAILNVKKIIGEVT
jgi:hypothetical protein